MLPERFSAPDRAESYTEDFVAKRIMFYGKYIGNLNVNPNKYSLEHKAQVCDLFNSWLPYFYRFPDLGEYDKYWARVDPSGHIRFGRPPDGEEI